MNANSMLVSDVRALNSCATKMVHVEQSRIMTSQIFEVRNAPGTTYKYLYGQNDVI
jgi:hypothetical protein